MHAWVGTSGYDFDEWRPSFYAADLPRGERLREYSRHLRAVEINNTFYRTPRPANVASWAAQVGGPFRFAMKAPRYVTHGAKLADIAQPIARIWEAAQELGPHLGPILFQLPPAFRRDDERLAHFLAGLPDGMRAVVEFRHPSWDDPAVGDVLRARGASWCTSDRPRAPATEIAVTADWGYVRLHRPTYTDHDLASWRDRIAAQPWREVFVFFDHDPDSAGPAAAQRLAALLAAS